MTEMPTVETLDELTELVRRHPGMFVRWSRGPGADTADEQNACWGPLRRPAIS